MKKITLLSTLIIIATIYFIINNTIGKDDGYLSSVKKNIPWHIKEKLLNTVFIFKNNKILNEKINKVQEAMIVKSDAKNNFELEEANSIYVYTSDFEEEFDLKIYGYLKEKKITCLTKQFSKNTNFKINELNKDCKNSIFFKGQIIGKERTLTGRKNLFFYFSTKKEKIAKNNTLLILPVSNFYNYSSNNLGSLYTNNSLISSESVEGMPYISKISSIPQQNALFWAEKTFYSIKNLNDAGFNFDIQYDFNFEKIQVGDYDLVIFPMHQEYISYKMIDKITNFLDKNSNKKVLSIGGANFMREINFVFHNKDFVYFEYPDRKIKGFQNVIRSFDQEWMQSKKFIDCKYNNLKNEALGEIFYPLENKRMEKFLFKIECQNIKIPIVTKTNFQNGVLIQITADTIGMRFNQYPEVKNFITKFLN